MEHGKHWKFKIVENSIALLAIDRSDSEANALSEEVLLEFNTLLDKVEQDKKLTGLVITSAKEKQFIAGADIKVIEKFQSAAEASEGSRLMQSLFNRLSTISIPSVAAIHGACLGGGLELALACRFRVASNDSSTVLGLPEIQLGIIPGAGGTQRLPRLIGIQQGLDLILTGKRVKAEKCLKLGLVDAVVHMNLLENIACDFIKKKRSTIKRKNSLSATLLEKNPIGRRIMHSKAKEMVTKTTKGFYPAAYKALEAVFQGYATSLEKGLEIEARFFGELAMTKESKSLIHLFHATTEIKKHPYKEAGKAVFGEQKTSMVGVIGAGFMGTGIATVCADKNIRVRLSDPSKESNARAVKHLKEFFKKRLKRKQIKAFEFDQKLSHVSPGLSTKGLESCDIVIEAVFEDLKLKQKLISDLEQKAHPHWIFASNTSAIPITKIAQNAAHPEKILGMHFFSPVEKMPLLEIVTTEKTAPWATARAIELGQKLGKQVIVVKDGPGFYTTRALSFYLNEGALMLAEGARIDKLDKALMDFGFPVGPITLIDEVGIDVGAHVLETMEEAFPQRVKVPEALSLIQATGRLGRKNQKGFYLYENGEKKSSDPEIYQMLAKFKVAPKGIPSDEMVDRCVMVFINESVRCLEENILASPYDGDVGAVFGLGFPPFWGGPFRYIDYLGASTVCQRLSALENTLGPRFSPAKLLLSYAQSGRKFFPGESNRDGA